MILKSTKLDLMSYNMTHICWFQHLYNVSRRPNSTNTKCNNGYENDRLQNPINDSIISSIPFYTWFYHFGNRKDPEKFRISSFSVHQSNLLNSLYLQLHQNDMLWHYLTDWNLFRFLNSRRFLKCQPSGFNKSSSIIDKAFKIQDKYEK